METPEKKWKLGDDVSEFDNLLDGITFQDLITAVRCNCPVVNRQTIKKTVQEILEPRLEDMWFLIENNVAEITAEATKYRGK